MRHSVFVGMHAVQKIGQMKSLIDAEGMLIRDFKSEYTDEARDEIYRKTGWWRGTDGKWRFKIRDVKPKKRGTTIKNPFGDDYTVVNGLYKYGDRPEVKWCPLTDMVSHTQLFKAYPDGKRYQTRIAKFFGKRYQTRFASLKVGKHDHYCAEPVAALAAAAI